jgi:predicted Zn-dependent protease
VDLRAKLAHRPLPPGRYRAVLSATAAGESAHRTFGFRVKEFDGR